MSDFLSIEQRNALDSVSPRAIAAGANLGDLINQLFNATSSGNFGIESEADDIDSITLNGGAFSWDRDTTTGLTFAFGAGRLNIGKSVTAVAAGTVALTGSTTNYVEVNPAGAVSANAVGFTAGSMPLFQIVTGVGTITTVTQKKALLFSLPSGGITGDMLSIAGRTKSVQRDLGDISATASFKVIAPSQAARVSRVAVAVDTTHVADNTNYWTLSGQNKGPAGSGTTALFATDDLNTTKSTGGAGLTANVARTFVVHGTPTNLDTAANDVLLFTFTKTAAAVTLAKVLLLVDFTFTN